MNAHHISGQSVAASAGVTHITLDIDGNASITQFEHSGADLIGEINDHFVAEGLAVAFATIAGSTGIHDTSGSVERIEVLPTANVTGANDLFALYSFADGEIIERIDGATFTDSKFGDIKLFQSENNGDDNNSGARSSIEILDGFLNNLFKGVSRIDALLGETEVRGIHVTIDSSTTETYLDAHIMINRVPESDFIKAWLVPSQDKTGAPNIDGFDYMIANRVYSMSPVVSHNDSVIEVQDTSIETVNNPDPIYALQVGDIPILVSEDRSLESVKGQGSALSSQTIQIDFSIPSALVGSFSFLVLTTQGLISIDEDSSTRNVTVDSTENIDNPIFNVSIQMISGFVRLTWTIQAGVNLLESVALANRSAFLFFETDVVDGTEVTNQFPVRESTGVLELEDDLNGLITNLVRVNEDIVEVTYTHDAAMNLFAILNLSESNKEIFVEDDIVVLWENQELIESGLDGRTLQTVADITYLDVINVNDNQRLDRSNFAVDFVTGSVTFIAVVIHVDQYGNNLDSSSDYRIEYRRSEMLVIDSINDNTITTAQPIQGTYNDANLSSVILLDDLVAEAPILFSQEVFNLSDPVWEDSRIGDNSAGQFNVAQFPVQLSNAGSINERWAIRFASANLITVIGERTGTVLTGFNINNETTLEPINPITGAPYFRINVAGFGAGWNTGNVIRFNTTGASHHFYAGRTVLTGATANEEDLFQIEVRGDIG